MTTSQEASTDPATLRRRELREFLMTRRARVSPAQAGLPDGGARRRTPGLRREEVAVLAGVGVSWYQWFHQYMGWDTNTGGNRQIPRSQY